MSKENFLWAKSSRTRFDCSWVLLDKFLKQWAILLENFVIFGTGMNISRAIRAISA